MTEEMRKQRLAEATKALNEVQAAVQELLRLHGFRGHGRLFHRFVDGDISQVVELQRGQAYREETHLFWVNAGIRVPECALQTFTPEENAKKYYHEYECSHRWTIGEQSKKKSGAYDLHKPVGPIIEDILHRLRTSALPMFDVLSSRDGIMAHRMEYPQLWHAHLFLLEKAMICGRRGETDKAAELFRAHYRGEGETRYPKEEQANPGHQAYLRELAEKLGIEIGE